MNPSSKSAPSPHEEVLRRHYRWMRAGLPLCVACAGLLITLAALWFAHPSAEPWKDWGWAKMAWPAGLGVSAGAGIGLWLLRRWSLLQSARRIDERLQSMNRLETAAQYSRIDDPLLRAQREETAAFLSKSPVRPRVRGFSCLVLVLWMLLLGHAATWLMWERPWIRPAVAAGKAESSPTPAALPEASIRWESPKAETKAAPIEEVPLKAVADSNSGLRDLSLEISVNGAQKLSAPISMAELARAGEHEVDASIYLDELNVEPYDMVSYFLRARRITDRRDVPETVSPVQFVEVKPFRDDISEKNGSPGIGQAALADITAIKVAQLRLIKENFTLAHAEIGHDQPDWQQENLRVGSQQGILETKTGEMLQMLIQGGAAPEVVDLVGQAKPLIGDAAKKIVAEQNDPALPVQGKALATITEIEKYLIKMAGHAQGDSKPQQAVADPFEKQRDVELKIRSETQAGILEKLAQEQARLAGDLARNVTASDAPPPGAAPDKNKITGTPGERQTQISQQVGALLNGRNFDPETTGHLEKGHEEALEALRQLDAEDTGKAKEPAAVAAQELQMAAESMNRAGDEKARQQLEAALHEMNQAADQARSAPNQASDEKSREAARKAAQQVEQTRRELADAAQEQQETGSKSAAEQMAALANALNEAKLRTQLQKLRDEVRNPATAEAAGRQLDQLAQRMTLQERGGPTREELAALIERMDRARVNLARLADLAGAAQRPRLPGDPPKGSQSQPGEERQQGQQGQHGQQGQTANADGTPNKQGTGAVPRPGQGQARTGDANGSSADGKSERAGGNSATGSAGMDDAHEQFTRSLMEQISMDTEAGARFLPNSQTIMEAQKNVHRVAEALRGQPADAYVAAYGRLNDPLATMIKLLRAELQRMTRQHELTDQDIELAPPAYRAAVADYFERLSRDYETAPEKKTQ